MGLFGAGGAITTVSWGTAQLINKSSPVQVGTDTHWASIAAGYYHSLGLKSDGTLWAWGGNNSGQLGDGTSYDRHSPVQIGTDLWASIAAGSYHSLGLKSDGTLWGWGWNYYGQLGDGTTVNKSSPVQIGTDHWFSVATGYYHSLRLSRIGLCGRGE